MSQESPPANTAKSDAAIDETKQHTAEPSDAAPASAAKTSTEQTALTKLSTRLRSILEKAGHREMYNVELTAPADGQDLATPTQVILQKFLRANAGDVDKAAEQLENALVWRKEFDPQKAVDETFERSRFEGLGYVIEAKDVPGSTNPTDVAVFNIYGAVKDNKKTFGDLDGFIRWRVALQELTVQKLNIKDAKTPVPDYGKGPDPYQAIQVHDYLSVSFLRQAPEVKAASSKTIELFQQMYPETVSKKYFVNVPMFMQWMFGAMKMLISKDTFQKMTWTSYGNTLHKDLGPSVPKDYGGSGPEFEAAGQTPKYN